MKATPHSSTPVAVPAARKPAVIDLLHVHVYAQCGKLRVCEVSPCWLRYWTHARMWAWTCPRCNQGPAEPAVAVPIAA